MDPVDLTLEIRPGMPTFPNSPKPAFIRWADLGKDGYNLELLFLSSHAGTHIDAPYHFTEDGMSVDQIPLGRLTGRGRLARMALDPADNHAITKAEIVEYEREHGTIPDGSSIFIQTGWQKNLKRPNYFTENPGLDRTAASYFASKRINMVGTDSPSIDPGFDTAFSAHRILAKNNVLIVENLSNLEKIAGQEIDFTILPMKIKGATGSPVRAIATGAGSR